MVRHQRLLEDLVLSGIHKRTRGRQKSGARDLQFNQRRDADAIKLLRGVEREVGHLLLRIRGVQLLERRLVVQKRTKESG